MGKTNITSKAAVEIIPITEKRSIISNSNNLLPTQRAKMNRLPYMSDPLLVPRVQKYLESNVDKTYVDIHQMADELQKKYREYGKRKRGAFRASVRKAYALVLQSYGLDDQPGSSSEEDVSEGSVPENNAKFQDNMINNQLMAVYTRPQMSKQMDESELIDISSDDSDENSPENSRDNQTLDKNKSNGPSGSSKGGNNFAATIQYIAQQQKKLPNPHSGEDLNSLPVQPPGNKKRKYESDNIMPMPVLTSAIKKKKSLAVLQEPVPTFKDIGGLDHILIDVCRLLTHFQHPEVYREIGISPPTGFLLHGPPGCGKTLLANAIAGEIRVILLKVAAPELVAGVSGESESRIRELFERALASAPCVLFIDEIDAITPNRQNVQKEMERRIVAQLLSCLDDLNQNGGKVLVIGATNRPDSIDPALRRAGRFDREISLGIPNVASRVQILKTLTCKLKLSENFDYETIAKLTPGYVGADLMSLVREAAMIAVNRVFKDAQTKIQNTLRHKESLPPKLVCEVSNDKKKSTESNSDASKNEDAEIIVDDIEEQSLKTIETLPKEQTSETQNDDDAVLVIDDDAKGSNDTPTSGEMNGTAPSLTEDGNSEHIDVVTMPVTTVKQLTPLEEMIRCLHEKAPLSKEQLKSLFISMEDFVEAVKHVQPSAKREGFATVPDVTWDDVGSLRDIREELQMAIVAPVRHAEQFKSLGLDVPAGVLLCGPPGCGKTLLAKAIANEAGINFISVKGPELLNMYVGESERAVRICFERARNSAPCVIFFDELDALCPKRSDSREGGATMRVVNQMLTEMDGVEGRSGVFLLAATNRPDIVDPAVLRPGRLDKILYVGLPSSTDRVDILRAITKNGTKPLLSPDVDLDVIGKSEECRGYTGADLAALVREAATVAMKEIMTIGAVVENIMVTTEHFNKAVTNIRPSVTDKDQKHYEKLRKMYSPASALNEVEEMELS